MNDYDSACLNCDSHSHPTHLCPHEASLVYQPPGLYPTPFKLTLDRNWFTGGDVLDANNQSYKLISEPVPLYYSRNRLQRFINWITFNYFYQKIVRGWEYDCKQII